MLWLFLPFSKKIRHILCINRIHVVFKASEHVEYLGFTEQTDTKEEEDEEDEQDPTDRSARKPDVPLWTRRTIRTLGGKKHVSILCLKHSTVDECAHRFF